MPLPMRFRWFGFQVPPGRVPALGRFMLDQPYGRGEAKGFRLDRVQRDEIVGRYVEKRDYTEQIADPLGETVEVRRVEFRQVGFRIRADAPVIEVADSSKDCRLLFQKLEEFYGERMEVRPLVVDVLAWLEQFERHAGRVKVIAARLVDLSLSTSVSASVIFSGVQDVRPHLEEWRRGRSGVVERIHIELPRRGMDTWSVEFVRDARAVIHAGGASVRELSAEALQYVLLDRVAKPQPPAN